MNRHDTHHDATNIAPVPLVRGRIARLQRAFLRADLIPFLPAIGLAGYWFGVVAMLSLVIIAMIVAWLTEPTDSRPGEPAEISQPPRSRTEDILDRFIRDGTENGLRTACLVIGLDHAQDLETSLGGTEFPTLMQRVQTRLQGALRDADQVIQMDRGVFAVALSPNPHPDIENMIQLAVRLQTACEITLPLAGRSLSLSVHIGIALIDRAPARNGAALLMAAEDAAQDAARCGPGAIRAFSAPPLTDDRRKEEMIADLLAALNANQVTVRFQPQISMDTGAISGMQALPYWHRSSLDIIPPEDIASLAEGGQFEDKIMDTLLHQALESLRNWDRNGLPVATVSVALPVRLLRTPKLVDRLKWIIEGCDIDPNRLCLVLTSVPKTDPASRDNTTNVLRVLNRCADLGCQIELISHDQSPLPIDLLRDGRIGRWRLAKNLTQHIDRKADQQRMIAAIVAMADELKCDVIAEGVSTLAENAVLAQLGCRHLQGDAISAPLPADDVASWIVRHCAKLSTPPRISTRREV